MMERPTFYAVIPAHVRYANISAHAKLLDGELTALTEKEGVLLCLQVTSPNSTRTSRRSVSRWVAEAGFIVVEPALNNTVSARYSRGCYHFCHPTP